MNKFVYIFASSLLLCISCDRFNVFRNPREIEVAKPRYTPKEALEQLQHGNLLFQKDLSEHSKNLVSRRVEMSNQQNPFAIVVGCSDARVPPELIFGQGLGDIFSVRVAGSVIGPVELDSIEYAAKYLGASIVVVLGHQDCGAIKAVQNNQTQDIEQVADLIRQAVPNITSLNLLDATEKNVEYFVDFLNKSPVIQKMVASKKMQVVGGMYHLENGEVIFLPENRSSAK